MRLFLIGVFVILTAPVWMVFKFLDAMYELIKEVGLWAVNGWVLYRHKERKVR